MRVHVLGGSRTRHKGQGYIVAVPHACRVRSQYSNAVSLFCLVAIALYSLSSG